jgi:hypothetical protein
LGKFALLENYLREFLHEYRWQLLQTIARWLVHGAMQGVISFLRDLISATPRRLSFAQLQCRGMTKWPSLPFKLNGAPYWYAGP